MRKFYLLLSALSIILISSCSEDKIVSDQHAQVVPVRLSNPIHNNTNQFVSASGKTEAEKSANISTRMMGYVEKINVKAGQKVVAGQMMLAINGSDLIARKAQAEAGIVQANAAYENAKKDFERFVILFDQQSASQKELDDMSTRYDVAKASLEAAKQIRNEVMTQFSYSNITAPFSGTVTNIFVKEGDMANPGMPLISIEGASRMQVTAMVSESDISSIKNGMAVTVLVKSVNIEVKGIVSELSQSSKNTGGQYLVKVNLDKSDGILSGMFVNVKFPKDTTVENKFASDMILIPEEALVKQGQLSGVYTIGEGQVAILRWLRIGKKFGNEVQVLSGLSAEEKYIVSADGKLFNGVKVSF
jgi:RND family efflux transporter MFP subunit